MDQGFNYIISDDWDKLTLDEKERVNKVTSLSIISEVFPGNLDIIQKED
jgi:hypothetical protein